MKTKTVLIIFVFLTALSISLQALPVRWITTFDTDVYSYDETAVRLEEVAILRLNPVWTVVLKGEWEKAPAETKTTGTAGLVFGLFPGSYMEVSYGLSVDDGKDVSHLVFTDLYYERPNLLLLLTHKLELNRDNITSLPGFGVKWGAMDRLSLWGKYTAAIDQTTGFDNSFWGETEYLIGAKFSVKAGGTVGTYHEDGDSPRSFEYSFLSGLGFTPRGGMRFSWQAAYLIREEYNVFTNLLVADIRF